MIEERISKQQYMGWEADLETVARIDNQIRLRKAYLIAPWNPEHDENVGGGRGSKISKPEESYVSRLGRDKRLRKLELLKENGKEFLSELDKPENEELKDIYKLKFVKANYMGWNDVGDTLGYSSKSLYRRRRSLLKLWGKICGEC